RPRTADTAELGRDGRRRRGQRRPELLADPEVRDGGRVDLDARRVRRALRRDDALLAERVPGALPVAASRDGGRGRRRPDGRGTRRAPVACTVARARGGLPARARAARVLPAGGARPVQAARQRLKRRTPAPIAPVAARTSASPPSTTIGTGSPLEPLVVDAGAADASVVAVFFDGVVCVLGPCAAGRFVDRLTIDASFTSEETGAGRPCPTAVGTCFPWARSLAAWSAVRMSSLRLE